MSSTEIEYIVPLASRQLGDVETIVNAMGAFEGEQPFPFSRDYSISPTGATGDTASVKLTRKSREPKYDHELREDAERMRRGVNGHFLDADRHRLSRHFAGIAIRDPIETEQS
jgi:hypothetical protein